jgi:hypothetical protein
LIVDASALLQSSGQMEHHPAILVGSVIGRIAALTIPPPSV